MKIAVQEVDPSGNSTWLNLDHITSQDLADLWESGVFIAPCLAVRPGKATTLKFDQADAVLVRILLKRLPLEVAMAADFTQSYASVAAYSATADGESGELLLAFALPEPITDAKTYARLLAGIETIYAGSMRHANAEQAYGLNAGSGTATVLKGKLDRGAVRNLDKLGRESKELGKGHGGYLRVIFSIIEIRSQFHLIIWTPLFGCDLGFIKPTGSFLNIFRQSIASISMKHPQIEHCFNVA